LSYDFVVVGSGMFGATFAREAACRGRKVLVIEKRSHTGGMCHTKDDLGYPVHVYGPHVFHTNSPEIWEWVNKFTDFRQFSVRTKCIAKGKVWSFPINLMTLYQMWGVKNPEEAAAAIAMKRLHDHLPDSIEGWCLSNFGHEIYETFIRGYTLKQWGRDPAKLPAEIVRRLPFRLAYDDSYFTDRYQGIPIGGFNSLFDRVLDHGRIEVRTGEDYLSDPETFNRMGHVVYSGRIDEFFGYCHGPLAFRSCRWENELHDGDFQGCPVINYADENIPFTRVIEHKHFANPEAKKSLVSYEFPFEAAKSDLPLYPVRDVQNVTLYEKYDSIKTNVTFGGRLGSYRYFDMCEVIAQAMKLVGELT
jgi:UDP-galactopyranose mutase